MTFLGAVWAENLKEIGDAGRQTRAPSSELFKNLWGGRERHQIGENIFRGIFKKIKKDRQRLT